MGYSVFLGELRWQKYIDSIQEKKMVEILLNNWILYVFFFILNDTCFVHVTFLLHSK